MRAMKKAARSGGPVLHFVRVPGCPGGRLALRELLAPARLVQTDLLALDFAGVAGDEPCLRQRGFQLRIVIDQCARDAVPYGARLPRLAPADDVDHDVERLLVVG